MGKQREPGYYWVKRTITWIGPPEKKEVVWGVAQYKYGRWHLTDGGICDFDDSYFDEIDENMIERKVTVNDIAKHYEIKDEPLSNYPSARFGCPDSCKYTGDCWASFTADEPCRRTPPSQDWIRARTPSHLKRGNL